MAWKLLALLACARAPAPQPVTVVDEAGFQALLATEEPRVVNLFATWCSACRGEIGEFRAFKEQEPGVDLALVSLDRQGATVAGGRVLARRSGRVDTTDLAALLQEARTGYTGAP